jgi:nitroimidazol reductase NimA-like FMN-containing flavoprotein (pyridoxamine 5'-phosphate oxidase superfamily)
MKDRNRTRVRRAPDRGHYDRATIDAILDDALVCHVGFVDDGQPFVIPTMHVRVDDHVYIHGATGSRMVKVLSDGAPACVTVTLVDGLVLARSAFHQAVNYRSVVVLGTATRVDDPEQKCRVLHEMTERFEAGRWDDIRHPNEGELARTVVLGLPLDEASAKIRTGGPRDEPEDYASSIWAGVIPLELTRGEPIPDENGGPAPS